MSKRNKIAKRFIAFCMVIIFSVNSFAAIVADNDGSAFVTKAEFEALKDDFAKQVQSYEDSIVGKIDGAIAAYLAGIRTGRKSALDNIYNQFGGSNIRWYKSAQLWTTNVKRPDAEVASYFYVFPSSNYWSKYTYHYYRMKTSWDLISSDTTQGGGVSTKRVANQSAFRPQKTKLGLIQYEVDGSLNKLVQYFKYAHLYEAWSIWFNNSTPSGNHTWYFNFYNCTSNKNADGNISATNATVEASACRIIESTESVQNLEYAACSDAMSTQHIMVNDTEYKRYNTVLSSSVLSEVESNDNWYKTKSYSSSGSSQFFRVYYQNLCDYKYTTESASSTTWHKKPWDLLNFGHATEEYPVKLYEGIPLCRSEANGTIEVSSIKTSRTADIYFAIRNEPFKNETINGNVTLDDSTAYTKVTSGSGADQKTYYKLNTQGAKITFPAAKDTTYYIKFWYSGSLSQWQYTTATIGDITGIEE